MSIIGITGRKYHGKDTIGDHLIAVGYIKLSFASALKDIGSILGLSYEQLYGNLKEEVDEFWNATPRHILQFIGTDLLRNQFDEQIWIKIMRRQIEKLRSEGYTKFVICDVRFPNEAEFVREIGGQLWRVSRELIDKLDMHESESHIDVMKVDHDIINNGTIKDLYAQVDQIRN